VKRILIVCTGNVCRSPLAAAMLRQKLGQQGRDDIEVLSAGTSAAHGEPASEGSYLVALEHGVDLSAHAARLLTEEEIETADLILGMSEHHVQRAGELGAGNRAWLLGRYAGVRGPEAIVEDPFGGDLREYRSTYEQLDGLLDAVATRILKETRESAEPSPDGP
jgi:protein-tyrosine phosphatase